MMCTNPRQDYLVVFDAKARAFVINPDTETTSYAVLAIEDSKVAGAVGYDSGMSFLADFGDQRHIDFYIGAEIVQTDSCRSVLPAYDYRPGDNLLGCLIGRAAIEMRHGAKAKTALSTIEPGCIVANPEPDAAGDWLDDTWNTALRSLEAMEKAGVF